MTYAPNSRPVTCHHVPGITDGVVVFTTAPGIYRLESLADPSLPATPPPFPPIYIQFQDGDPAQRINGITPRALLGVLIDHLECEYAAGGHQYDSRMISHLNSALGWSQSKVKEAKAAADYATQIEDRKKAALVAKTPVEKAAPTAATPAAPPATP